MPGGHRQTLANDSKTVLASTARTTTPTISAEDNFQHRGILIVVDVTAVTATPAVTPSIKAKDESGYDATIWTAAAAIATTGQYSYLIYPGAITGDFDGTEAVGFPLPLEWQLVLTHGDTDSITYSIRQHNLK